MPERVSQRELFPTVRATILVVDDEESGREAARMVLQPQYRVRVADSAEAGLEVLTEEPIHLVLMDLKMPGMGGMSGLKKIRSSFPHIPVVMMTAFQTVPTAVEAMKLGASEYLIKPFDVIQLRELAARNIGSTFTEGLQACGDLLASSPLMLKIFGTIRQVADKDVTVLITGESGTGKELVAQAIHRHSLRTNRPFVVVNCAAIPETLMESELFGHERGAFTHADRRRLGQFEIAHTGTIFLDEIGEMSLATQAKLLRVLQNRSFYRVGGSELINVAVRILAATNRNLEREVREGRFREDLFYRLNVVHVSVPPLRERPEDITSLAEHFLAHHLRQAQKPPRQFTQEVLQALRRYSWPGNVRELVNLMERLAVLSPQAQILLGELPEHIRNPMGATKEQEDHLLNGDRPFDEAVHALEGRLIRAALRQAGGVQTSAATLLGISRRILKYKMDKLGIHT